MPPKRKGGKRQQGVELNLADFGGGQPAVSKPATQTSHTAQNYPSKVPAGESRRAVELTRSINEPA